MIIQYGIHNTLIDVTSICYTKLKKDNYIIIPSTDKSRAQYFTDPVNGVLKSVFITNANQITTEYDHTKTICIDTTSNTILEENEIPESIRPINVDAKIATIHSKLKIKYGSLNEEFPEQKMAVRYLRGHEKVLEIGGNIGRNSLVISHILGENSKNFVVLETDVNIANQLKENRDLNNMNFHIENSALSKRPLIQKGWDTMVSDVVLPGYTPVSILSYEDLQNKYNIPFDTLVVDCEGAFYYILQDMPEILSNVNLIIMENDYYIIEHKQTVDSILKNNGFYVDYSESGGWGCCYNNFFEVWKKNVI